MSPLVPHAVRALVLRATDIGETSRLVSLFSAELGRIAVRARGVRRRGSRHAAVLEPFTLLEARILHREGAEVHLFIDGSALETHDAVRTDVAAAAVGAVWLELLDRVDCSPAEAPAILDWTCAALAALRPGPDALGQGLLLAWQLLGQLGHAPQLERCVDSGEPPREPLRFHLGLGGLLSPAAPAEPLAIPLAPDLAALLAQAAQAPPERLGRVRLSGGQCKRLLDLFDRFCQVQLELRLRSLRFLASLDSRR